MTLSPATPPARRRRALVAAALLTLAAGCTTPEEPAPTSPTAASDAGGSDGGGAATASAPEPTPIAATPAPSDFTPPANPCTGEGIHLVEQGTHAKPALPARAGQTLTIGLDSMTKDTAALTASVGSGKPRKVDPVHIGDTVQVDLWTISVTSICPDQRQVEFDVID